mmetsp:Transcript_8689/g.28434  ORF Transcript_8689/g.28434 Transcript_8689/m.28434 type:complete len:236 (-) Transcript_8689:691-1398(-)
MQPPGGSEGTSDGCRGGRGGTIISVATPTRSARRSGCPFANSCAASSQSMWPLSVQAPPSAHPWRRARALSPWPGSCCCAYCMAVEPRCNPPKYRSSSGGSLHKSLARRTGARCVSGGQRSSPSSPGHSSSESYGSGGRLPVSRSCKLPVPCLPALKSPPSSSGARCLAGRRSSWRPSVARKRRASLSVLSICPFVKLAKCVDASASRGASASASASPASRSAASPRTRTARWAT